MELSKISSSNTTTKRPNNHRHVFMPQSIFTNSDASGEIESWLHLQFVVIYIGVLCDVGARYGRKLFPIHNTKHPERLSTFSLHMGKARRSNVQRERMHYSGTRTLRKSRVVFPFYF